MPTTIIIIIIRIIPAIGEKDDPWVYIGKRSKINFVFPTSFVYVIFQGHVVEAHPFNLFLFGHAACCGPRIQLSFMRATHYPTASSHLRDGRRAVQTVISIALRSESECVAPMLQQELLAARWPSPHHSPWCCGRHSAVACAPHICCWSPVGTCWRGKRRRTISGIWFVIQLPALR